MTYGGQRAAALPSQLSVLVRCKKRGESDLGIPLVDRSTDQDRWQVICQTVQVLYFSMDFGVKNNNIAVKRERGQIRKELI